MNYSTENLIDFIKAFAVTDEVEADTDIFKDLHIVGDDFHDLIEAYAIKYSVNIENYLWYFHRNEEGSGIGELFFTPPYKSVERIPVTPAMLADFANNGAWNIAYPEHQLPKKRYDLLLNQILLIFLVLFLATLLLSCNQQSPKRLAEQIELIRKENDSLIRANNELENSYPKTVLGEANERLLLDSLLRNSENQVYFFRLYLCREFSDLLIQGSFDGKKAELFYTISNYSECHYNKIDTQHYLTKKIYVPISKQKWEDLYHQFEMFEQEDLSSDPSYYFGNPISCTYYLYVYAREKYETPHNWRITKKSVSYSAKDQLPNTKFYNFVLYLTALCKLEGGKNDTLFDFSKDL